MLDNLPRSPTRDDLQKFLPNQRSIRAFEQLFVQVGDAIPDEIALLKILIEELSTAAENGNVRSQQALDLLKSMSQSLSILATMKPEPIVPAQQDGLIFAHRSNPRLADLPDVLIQQLTAGQVLAFDQVTRRWRPTVIPLMATQNAAPSATGFSITINAGVNTWLLLKPTAGFATGTIVLPAVATCIDRQELTVSCTQQVNALTVNGNGATVNGPPSSLAADSTFKLRFNLPTTTWHRAT